MTRYFRPDFDRRRDFEATREFKFAAEKYVPGRSINKALFTDRKLRQLYDQRMIDYPQVPNSIVPKSNGKGSVVVLPSDNTILQTSEGEQIVSRGQPVVNVMVTSPETQPSQPKAERFRPSKRPGRYRPREDAVAKVLRGH